MKKISEFEIRDHGIDHSQYFQGCGVSHTRFNHVVTGCGSNAKEAFEDALEQMAPDGVETDSIEKDCDGKFSLSTVEHFLQSRGEEMTEECELYYYVSIRWNVEGEEK
jgi:hypothetical protein